MPDDNLTTQFEHKRAEIIAVLRNGSELSTKDLGWLVFGVLEVVEGMEHKQQKLYDDCAARLAYERGGWLRKLLQDKLATAAIAAFMLGVIWAIVQAVQVGFVLP